MESLGLVPDEMQMGEEKLERTVRQCCLVLSLQSVLSSWCSTSGFNLQL